MITTDGFEIYKRESIQVLHADWSLSGKFEFATTEKYLEFTFSLRELFLLTANNLDIADIVVQPINVSVNKN